MIVYKSTCEEQSTISMSIELKISFGYAEIRNTLLIWNINCL